MLYVLTGFAQDGGYRVFRFEGIMAKQERVSFSVRADLSLIRRYSIQIQDLPLLCRAVLESRDESDDERALTFGENQMRVHAEFRAEARLAADAKRRATSIRNRAAIGLPAAVPVVPVG